MIAGLLVALVGPGGALLFDAGTFLVSIACLVPLRPRVVRRVLAEEDPEATTEHFLASLHAGWVEVRSRPWELAFLGGMGSYHAIVLPAIFVLGPVLVSDELGGAPDWAIITAGFGLGCVLGDLLLLRWRPRRVVHRRTRGARRDLRDRHLHAVGDQPSGAHPRPCPLAGVQLTTTSAARG